MFIVVPLQSRPLQISFAMFSSPFSVVHVVYVLIKNVFSFITIIHIHIINQRCAHIGHNLALLYEIWQTMVFTHSREKPLAVQA